MNKNIPAVLFKIFLLGLVGFFIHENYVLCLNKFFSIDEFQYSHASWLMSIGKMPYRDFFLHIHPLSVQVLSAVLMFLDDNLSNIVILRMAMFGIMTITWISAANINYKKGVAASFLAIFFLMTIDSYVARVSEIRPDCFAFCMALVAVSCLSNFKKNPGLKGFVIGVLIVASVWSSKKSLFYLTGFLPLIAIDLKQLLSGKKEHYLGSIPWFCIGLATAGLIIIVSMGLNDAWAGFFNFTVQQALEHEKHYPKHEWTLYFEPFWKKYWWMMPFAIFQVFTDVFKVNRTGSINSDGTDFVLPIAMFGAFMSFYIQKAAYPYSLIPYIGFLSIYCARGMQTLISLPRALNFKYCNAVAFWALCTSILLSYTLLSYKNLKVEKAKNNFYQLKILKKLNEFTYPYDTIYDNAGSAFSRPHTNFYFYTDLYMRKNFDKYGGTILPEEIYNTETKILIRDFRSSNLPQNIKNYLGKYFQPYTPEIIVWGQYYRKKSSDIMTDTFLAIEDGNYFVYPKTIADSGELQIDGNVIQDEKFPLKKGEHQLNYSGDSKSFYVLWMPRNGETYKPVGYTKAKFSQLF